MVSVSTSIVNDVIFTQFMTKLTGSVACLGESCDPKIICIKLLGYKISEPLGI